MDLWSLLPITLTYFLFMSIWLQKVPPDPAAIIAINRLRFNFPVIGPTYFGSQWPYTGANSIAYLFGSSKITFKGSTNLFQEATSVENSFVLQLQNRKDIIKIAPSGSGYLYVVGPSTVVATYTIAFRESVPESGNQLSGVVGYKELKKNLDPTNFLIVPLSALVSFITFENFLNGPNQIRIWSDEFSTPTFGKYMMQTFLDSNNAFQLQISELNNSFKVTHPITMNTTIELPFSVNTSVSDLITNINNALTAALTGVEVQIESYNDGILYLRWTNNLLSEVFIGPDVAKDLLHQCAACATLGLYENGEIVTLPVNPQSSVVSPSPSVLQWPVTNNYQKFDNPGSADVDGLVNVYFTDTVPNQIIDLQPDLVFNASRTAYNQLLTSTKAFVTFEAWAGGGCSILENPKGPFYGGASSRFQITLNFIEAPIEIFVGFAGVRENDNYAQGGSHTSIKYNNELVCVLGSGGGASIGSNGGNGGGPIGPIVESGYVSTDTYLLFSGFSGSSKKFSIVNNPQVLGPDGKPIDTGDEPYDPPGPDSGSGLENNEIEFYYERVNHTGNDLDNRIGSWIVPLDTTGPFKVSFTISFEQEWPSQVKPDYLADYHISVTNASTNQIVGFGSIQSTGNKKKWALFDPLTTFITSELNVTEGTELNFYFEPVWTRTYATNITVKAFITYTESPGPNPEPTSVYVETWQGSGSSSVAGLHGFFVDTLGQEIQTLPSASGGSGSNQETGRITFGGQGALFDNVFGAGGGGSTIIMRTSPTFTVSAFYLNGPWVGSDSARPLGGGKGPYNAFPPPGYFIRSKYFCNTTNLITELCLTLWNRQKQRQWCEILLSNTAKQLFKNSKIVHTNYLFGESIPIGQSISYLAVGPSDLFVPSTGGPHCRNIDSGETVFSNSNLTLCIFNDGQILSIDDIPEYLNTSIFGPLNFTTTVVSIRIGASEPKGTYSSCIFLTVEEPFTNDGPFTWALKSNEFQSAPPIFSQGTQIQSQGLLPEGSNSAFVGSLWDRQINLPGTYPGSIITGEFNDLINSLYQLIPNINVGSVNPTIINFLNPVLPYKFEDEEISVADYIQRVWPARPLVELEPNTANLFSNSFLGLRVFIRPLVIPNIQRPLQQTTILNFGQDSEIAIPEGATTTIYCYGAGGSSVSPGTKIGADGSFARLTIKIRGLLVCRVGQAGGSGLPVGVCGGLGPSGNVLGGGCSFVETSDGQPIIYAGGGGSAGQFSNANRLPEIVFVPGLPEINFIKSSSSQRLFYSNGAGGSGFNWGQSGNSYGSAGSSGSSFAPGGFVGAPQNQKYYTPNISFGSNGLAGNGRIVIEFTY